MAGDAPLPLPESWFQVAWSDELASGAVRALRVCGHDVVLFRGADGRARLLDAICPHLGAHLGHGGRVEGNDLRCPFHGWRYGADGRCREIPYSDRIPARARLRAWPVQEVNGHICAWYSEDGRDPDYWIPELPELAQGRWTQPCRRTWRVSAPLQDIFENGIDVAHFAGIHGFEGVSNFDYRLDGPTSVATFENHTRVAGRVFRGHSEARSYGAAFVASLSRSQIRDVLFVLTGLPLDAEQVELRGSVTARGTRNRLADWGLARLITRQIFAEVEKDVRVWQHRAHLPRPALVPGDGPIQRYRSWFSQFYPARTSANRCAGAQPLRPAAPPPA